jgi:hypothetical protein
MINQMKIKKKMKVRDPENTNPIEIMIRTVIANIKTKNDTNSFNTLFNNTIS